MENFDLKNVQSLFWNGLQIQKIVRCSDNKVLWEANGEIKAVCYFKIHNSKSTPQVFIINIKNIGNSFLELKNINTGDYQKQLIKNAQKNHITIPQGDYYLYLPETVTNTNTNGRQQTIDATSMILEYHKISSDYDDSGYTFGTSRKKDQSYYAYQKLSCYDSTPITHLVNYKFYQCTSLSGQFDLVDWDNVTFIGTNPLTCQIPYRPMPHLTYLGGSIYKNRSQISGKVNLNDYFPQLEQIGSACFQNCPITHLTLPSTLKLIGQESCWSNSTNLTSITFGDNVQTIYGWAFKFFAGDYVKLPNSLTYMGDGVFNNCVDKTGRFCTFDFSDFDHIPTITGPYDGTTWRRQFGNDINRLRIVIPDALYDQFCAANVWSTWQAAFVRSSQYTK